MSNRFSQVTTVLWQKIALVLLGLFLSLVLLEVGMRLGGFVLLSIQEYGNLRSMEQKSAYRILCIGESTTQGQYPHLLERILNQRNVGVRFSVIDKGRGGKTTAALLEEIGSNLTEYHPDMVVAMMGINDQGKHMPFENATLSKGTLFIRSLRIYRLTRFLWLRFLTQAMEMGFYKPDEARRSPEKTGTYLSGAVSKEAADKSVLTEVSRKKAMQSDPKNDNAFVESGRFSQEQDKLSPIEDSLGKAILLDPENDHAYSELEKLYRLQGKVFQAEDFLKKAIELDPKNDRAYVGLGRFYLLQKELFRAEDSFKKAIEFNPENANAYVGLGYFYQEQEELSQAEDSFKKAIGINPKSDKAYTGLGKLYLKQGKFFQAEDFSRKAIELNPKNDKAYTDLGKLYLIQGKFSQAEDFCRKAVEIDPQNANHCFYLGRIYRVQGKFSQAEGSFKKALEIEPESDRTFRALTSLYEEMGKPELAKEYAKKADRLGVGNFASLTLNNYRKLKEILDRKGIKLVCVQYPRRNVEPLKKIFEKNEGVIFVDNESIFKEAVKKGGYNEYFKDMFGGDFGHCTEKGNMLLAQNIADVILKEVFNKS